MLNLRSPMAPHIFAAEVQLNLILHYAERISVSDRAGRLFKLETIRPAFIALHWLHKERFGGSEAISTTLAELETEVETLARLDLRETRRWSGDPAEICPVCAERLTIDPILRPIWSDARIDRRCQNCLKRVLAAFYRVSSVEEGFCTIAI